MFFCARLSLALLWIFTGLTSVFFAPQLGFELLLSVSIEGKLADVIVYAGSVLDISIGLWLLSALRLQYCYLLQLTVIIVYSLLLTIIDGSFWLHPFGPITKNIPILMLIFILYKREGKSV